MIARAESRRAALALTGRDDSRGPRRRSLPPEQKVGRSNRPGRTTSSPTSLEKSRFWTLMDPDGWSDAPARRHDPSFAYSIGTAAGRMLSNVQSDVDVRLP